MEGVTVTYLTNIDMNAPGVGCTVLEQCIKDDEKL